jgi:hypothetical protein
MILPVMGSAEPRILDLPLFRLAVPGGSGEQAPGWLGCGQQPVNIPVCCIHYITM